MTSSTRRFAPLGGGAAPALASDRLAAQAQGYAVGWAQGQQAAMASTEQLREALVHDHEHHESVARAAVEQLLVALRGATLQVLERTTPAVEDMTELILESAVALARAVLGAELRSLDDAALDGLRRALAPLPADGAVTVRVSPADHDHLRSLLGQQGGAIAFGAHQLQLHRDATLAPGDAVAEQAGSIVDARIEAGLARALAAVHSGRPADTEVLTS